jgi:2-oxoglutarate dehydrogenase E1 component
MTDQPANDQFKASSFLQGHNAAYVEQLYARYATDPTAVDAAWADYFRSLGDDAEDVAAEAQGPSWARADWPPAPSGELISALDGQWPGPAPQPRAIAEKIAAKAAEGGVAVSDEQMKRAVLDSIRALMLIRAYRIRGHLVADLDPLGMRDQTPHPELDPKSYGFTEPTGPADLHRQRAGAADRQHPRDPGPSSNAPIAAPSRCSTCISPIPNRPAG